MDRLGLAIAVLGLAALFWAFRSSERDRISGPRAGFEKVYDLGPMKGW